MLALPRSSHTDTAPCRASDARSEALSRTVAPPGTLPAVDTMAVMAGAKNASGTTTGPAADAAMDKQLSALTEWGTSTVMQLSFQESGGKSTAPRVICLGSSPKLTPNIVTSEGPLCDGLIAAGLTLTTAGG